MDIKVLSGVVAALTAFFLLQAQGLQASGPAAAVALEKKAVPAKDAPKKPVNVLSDRMETDRTEKFVIFTGNVAAEEDFILCSEELRVSYDENNEIREIKADRNIRILKDGKTAASDSALYDRKAGTILLTGRAVVNQCSDSVRGGRITFYTDSDRALVEGQQGARVKAVVMPDKKCREDEKAMAVVPAESAEVWCKKHPSLPR